MKISLALVLLLVAPAAAARDRDGRFAGSPLHDWFMGLRSGMGPCCSDADGNVVTDTDWESKDGHYRVRIMDQWWNVPDEAVIVEPNRYGLTVVWPYYSYDTRNKLEVKIRCFMPGAGM